MSEKKINKLRKKIDSVDLALVKLLKKRSYLVNNIGTLKGNRKINIGREVKIAYKLNNLDTGLYDKANIQKIWRDIISASIGIEMPLQILVLKSSDFSFISNIKDHFGSYCEIVFLESTKEILERTNTNPNSIAILPSFSNDSSLDWWLELAKYSDLKIALSLPFIKESFNAKAQDSSLVICNKDNISKTGFDNSLFLIENDTSTIWYNLKLIKSTGNKHLLVIKDFVDSPKVIADFTKIAEEKIIFLGSYPKPLFE